MHTQTRTSRPAPARRLAAMVAVALLGVTLAASHTLLASTPVAPDQKVGSQPMEGVGIDEKLGEKVPLDLTFTDDLGKQVKLGDYFVGDRPVILSLVYYRCPGMCKAELSAMVDVFKRMTMTPGKEFQIVCVSIDPEEGPNEAAAKKATHLRVLNKPEAQDGWAFLTGDADNIAELAAATGFRYRYIDDANQYAHDSALMLVTPDGRLSRYLRGFHFEDATVQLALVEASGGKIGSLGERIKLQLCGYDPRYGKYVLAAHTVMKIGGAMTMLLVAGIVGFFWWREFTRRRKASNSDSEVQVHPV